MDIATQPKLELIQVADVVARDKGIDREEVLIAMEQAIQKAGRSKYGPDHDIRATIDRRTGEIGLKRCTTVVETVEEVVDRDVSGPGDRAVLALVVAAHVEYHGRVAGGGLSGLR